MQTTPITKQMDPAKILQIQPGFSDNVEINVSEMQTIVSNKMKFSSLRAHTSTPNQELVDQSHSGILSELSKMIKDQIKVIYRIYLFIFKLISFEYFFLSTW